MQPNKSVIESFVHFLRDSKHIDAGTVRSYKSDVVDFDRYFDTPFTEITLDDIYDYADYLQKRDIPLSTINRRMTALRHLTAYLHEQLILDQDLSEKIVNRKVQRKDPIRYSPSLALVALILLLVVATFAINADSQMKLFTSIASQRISSIPETASMGYRVIDGNTLPNTLLLTSDDLRPALSGEAPEVLSADDSRPAQYDVSIPTPIAAGKASVASGQTETTIYSSLINADAILSLTPGSQVDGSFYIKSQTNGAFTIALSSEQNHDILFHWVAVQK